MNRLRTAALALAATALLAAPLAAEVSTDWNHDINFRSYHTFSFLNVQSADPFYDQRIKDEMTRDLTQAGWQRVPSGGDVTITAFAGMHNEKEYDTFYNGLGYGGWGWGGWGGWWGGGWGPRTTTVRNIPVGTLLIDMYDAHTHQLIWRGRSSDTLSNNPGKDTKKLDKDIDHMLNGFPPPVSRG